MTFSSGDLVYVAPFLVLAASGVLLVLAEAFFSGKDRSALAGLTVAGALASSVVSVVLYRQMGPSEAKLLFSEMLIADRTGYVLSALFGVVAALAALLAPAHQRAHGWVIGEYYGILLLAASGMVILAQAANLATVFLGVETMSIAVYVMTALRRRSRRGNEAALKYFLMGAFATGFLLYGMALVYGAVGTTSLVHVQGRLASGDLGLLTVGMFLMIAAFAFKVAAVPFHMWAPDAYEGAPTPVTAFMAAAVKAAAVAAMIRVFGQFLGGDRLPYGVIGWASPLVVLAAITITVGNIAAIRSDNIKRMLAYSSISHGGVLLVGLCAMGLGARSGQASLVYYLIAYSLTTMGAFAVVAYVGNRDNERLDIDQWAGLASRHPAAALAMTVCLLSLGGMPPTGGFFAKFYVFKSAMDTQDQQLLWLVAIGVVNSAISIFYYLRLVTAMYFKDARGEIAPTRSAALAFVMAACPLVILEMGIFPNWWLTL
ncbi:MAG: NADH-quinone oxidoreductase subunit N [Kofleriaceae bacterium]|nr:NADH-quinone oxidoreductase subunit N [Kofleriaceae bacterium]MCL4225931.1 NADH-quinone oxidoreductase subunit N [Myxococcales bacterium]